MADKHALLARAEEQDTAARARALDTGHSFIVQAPAGSGKTELLIQRYLCLLSTVEEPEQVVAITFTRKATGEMRQRVAEALRQAKEDAPCQPHQRPTREAAKRVLARDAERGWALRHSPARLRILTIDALCASIVQRMPVTSRLGASPQVMERAQVLYARAARATVQLLAAEDEVSAAVRCALVHLENDVRRLEDLLAEMLAKRDQWLRHLDGCVDLEEVRAGLERALQRIVREQLGALRSAMPVELAQELVELGRFAAQRLPEDKNSLAALAELRGPIAAEPEHSDAWRAIAHLLLTGHKWRKPSGLTIKQGFPLQARREKARLGAILADLDAADEHSGAHPADDSLRGRLYKLKDLPPARYDETQWELMKALFVLLPRAAQELTRVFREAGTVDFIAIARAAQHALGSREQPTDLALGMGHAIRHLLLDEFQDTSVTQFELLKSLTAGWRPGDGRTLFLVGDPMQSIYRFRQAEVGLFLEVWEGSVPGMEPERLRLQFNFRAQQSLVDWVNATFPEVFPPENDVGGAAVAYTPCIASQPPLMKLREEVHAFLQMPGEARQTADEAEARRVVEIIEKARLRSPQGKVAILVRARSHLAAIVPGLKRSGIAFRALEIDCLAERPVVMDLLALTRALLHPADRPAWLTVLRAPWCGLTLADLLALCGGPPPAEPGADAPAGNEKREWPTVWEEMQEADEASLSDEGRRRLLRVRAVLRAALERRRRLPLRQWVESVWIALGGPACLASATELSDAEQFFELLEQLDCGGELADLDEIGQRMQELFAAPDGASENPVHIMTIFGAKGLEFDTVIVPGMGRRPASDDARLLLWEERPRPEGAELLLAPLKPRASSDSDPLYKYVDRAERRRSQQEGRRVLYVAATRAREELHLLGHVAIKKEDALELGAPDTNSMLAYLWPAVQARFEAALAEEERRRGAAAPRQLVIPALAAAAAASPHILRRLPAGWALPQGPPPLVWHPGVEPEAEPEAEISFRWVGETARHVGTVVHLMLQRMAREGLQAWGVERLGKLRPLLRALLANEGVTPDALEKAAGDVLASLKGTLADPRGRWTLEPHPQAQSEYALSGVVNGRVWNIKIDRTFVHKAAADEAGTRWIVDYKVSPHKGTQLEQFLDNEQKRYREKLEIYATLLARLDGGAAPIRIGLYFPLLRAWREWQPVPRAEAAPLGS